MIVYPVYVFLWPVMILFGCHGNIKFKKKKKKKKKFYDSSTKPQ